MNLDWPQMMRCSVTSAQGPLLSKQAFFWPRGERRFAICFCLRNANSPKLTKLTRIGSSFIISRDLRLAMLSYSKRRCSCGEAGRLINLPPVRLVCSICSICLSLCIHDDCACMHACMSASAQHVFCCVTCGATQSFGLTFV